MANFLSTSLAAHVRNWPEPDVRRADLFHGKCPKCNADLELYIDTSCGPPRSVSAECACGAYPEWKVQWTYDVWVEGLLD